MPARKHRRRNATSEISVEPIGELSSTRLFRSEAAGPSTIVRFDYQGGDEECILCWIDEEGKRHHSYKHSGIEWSHQENTHSGHAFGIFRRRDGKLLASYRPRVTVAADQVHVVTLAPSRLSAKIERVISEARVIAVVKEIPEFPADQAWTVTYSFTVPPLPQATNPHFFETNTFYVWGDLSFDEFSLEDSKHAVHNYKMNQIVPQVMCGDCVYASDPKTFEIKGRVFKTWVAQAQHYWQTDKGEEQGSRVVCGELFEVAAGERMRSTIRFTGETMIIRIASESRPHCVSEVSTRHVFPNDTSLFPEGWAEFFRAKQRHATKTFRARPCFNIEYKARKVDLAVLETMCPFQVHEASFPSAKPDLSASQWAVRGMNFECSKPIVTFC